MQSWYQEVTKLKAKYESLQRTQRLSSSLVLWIVRPSFSFLLLIVINLANSLRHFLGEDLGPLNVKELQNLEKQLEGALAQARQRKVKYNVGSFWNVLSLQKETFFNLESCSRVVCVFWISIIKLNKKRKKKINKRNIFCALIFHYGISAMTSMVAKYNTTNYPTNFFLNVFSNLSKSKFVASSYIPY